jgi:hypothetical protein
MDLNMMDLFSVISVIACFLIFSVLLVISFLDSRRNRIEKKKIDSLIKESTILKEENKRLKRTIAEILFFDHREKSSYDKTTKEIIEKTINKL